MKWVLKEEHMVVGEEGREAHGREGGACLMREEVTVAPVARVVAWDTPAVGFGS